MPDLELLLEAKRRGLLPADQANLLQEAMSRGLIGQPEAPAQEPTTGFTGAIGSSYQRLKGQGALLAGKVGLMDPAEAEQYYREQEKKAGAFKPTEKGWGEAPLTKVAELAGQSIPYMVAPIVAGAAGAIAAPELAVAGLGAGTLAAFGTNLGQFTASNLGRQMDTGKSLADTNLLKAGAAAIPQAALDTLSMKMAPGINRIFEQAGLKLTENTAEQIAKKGLLANAGELAYKTGKTAGVEGLTESAQQVFERLQAGLNITNEEARKEYFENFIGGAVLGGTIGGAGHVYEKAFPKTDKPETQPIAPAAPKPYLNEETDYKHPVHNPTGMFTAAELGDVAQQVNNIREAEGKPLLRSFSIEDLHDAKIGQDVIDGLVTAKTGYQGQEVTPQTVVDAAQNIDTSSKGFTDFLARTTGKSNLTEMTPPELHAAVTALNGLQGITELPEGTNSHAFKRSDYDQAIQNLSGSLQTNPFMGPTSVIHEIKTSLNTSDEIADQILKAALRNKELTITTTPHYDLTDAEGKVVFSTPVKAVADSAASKHGLNIVESSSEAIHLPTTEIKAEDLEAEQKDAPAEYELRAGNQLLDRFKSEDDAFTKAQEFQKLRATRKAAARDERIAALDEVDADAKKIEEMAALGKRDTPEYADAVAKAEAKAEQSMAKAKALELEQMLLDAPVSVVPYTAKAVFNREAQDKALDLAKDLHPQLKRFGLENVSLRVVDSIRNGTADGEYAQNLITIAMDADNPLGVLRHESIHALKELGAFTDAEWKVLTDRARKEWIPKYIQETGLYDEYYKQYTSQTGSDAGFQEYIEEEAIAEAFKHFSVKPPAGLLGNIVYRLKQFFAALKAAFKKQGFNTADSIFGRIEEGKVRPTLAPGTSNGKYSIVSLADVINKLRVQDENRYVKELNAGAEANEVNRQRDALDKARDFIFDNEDLFKIAQSIKDADLLLFDFFAEEKGVQLYGDKGLVDALKDYLEIYKDAHKVFENWYKTREGHIEQIWKGSDWTHNIFLHLKNKDAYKKVTEDYVDAAREYQKTANKKSVFVRRELAKLNKILPPVTELKVKKTKAKQQEGQVLPFVRPKKFERFSLRAPQTEAFKKWFGKSKIVDSNGEPKVMYHGTARDITAFRPKQAGAIFVTSDPQFAGVFSGMSEGYMTKEFTNKLSNKEKEELLLKVLKENESELKAKDSYDSIFDNIKHSQNLYTASNFIRAISAFNSRFAIMVGKEVASRLESNENIMPLYVKAENPFDYQNTTHVDRLLKEINKLPLDKKQELYEIYRTEGLSRGFYDAINDGEWNAIEAPSVQKIIKKLGHDSFYVSEAGEKNLAVYEPTQIKSATGNIGTYDINNPDIRFSLRAPDTKAFKEFFGNSKVVDKDGNPEVLYHGTTNDFSEFDNLYTIGQHFGTAKAANDRLKHIAYKRRMQGFKNLKEAEGVPEGANIMPVFVSLQNPLQAEDVGNWMDSANIAVDNSENKQLSKNARKKLSELADELEDERSEFDLEELPYEDFSDEDGNPAPVPDWANNWTVSDENRRALREIRYILEEDGFDGIVYTNDVEDKGKNSYIVFDSENVKSATGNIGTYDKEFRDVRFSIRAQVSPAITARVDTVSPARVEKGFVERILTSVFPESAAKFRIGYINALEGIERQTKAKANQFGNLELLADVSALAAANQSQRAAGIAAAAFQHGVPVYSRGRTTVSDLNGSVKGLLDALQPLMQLKDPEVFRYFQFYAGVKRGQRLLRSGKEKLFEQADAQKGRDLERQFPVFKQVFDDFQAYNKGQVKYMRDTGVISPAEERIWTQNWDYIPFYRQLDDEVTQGPKIFSSISGVAKPKELTGSAQYVVYDANGNEVGAYKQQAEANQHAARVNGTVQLEGTPLADFIETVVRNSRAAIEAGLKNEACRRAIRDAVALGTATRLPNVQAGTDVINYKENGKTVYYRVHDPLLVESLKGLNLPQVPMLGLFTGPARILREAVTKTPDFGIVNLMRDSLSTWITSGSKMTPIVDSFKQAGKILANRSPEAVELAKMGLGGYDFQGDVKASAEEFTKELRARTGNRTKTEQVLLPISKFWDMLEKGSYASDMATRVEVYKRVLADTGNEAEAWHQALEILNFSRRGNSQFIRVLSAIVPFLNARIQGLDVLYRSGFGQAAMVNKEEMRKAFWIRSLILLGLTGMYWAMVHDDDEYKKLTNEERDNYWIIPGLTVNGRPFRFPIPFELGTIFKVFPERILEATLGQDTNQDFMKAFKRNVMSNLSFNPVPVAALPIMENWFNYSVFTDRPVVGRGLEGLAPEAQYTSSTSEFAKDLGKIIGYSPIKIDHLIRGYTGNMGMYATSMLDTVLASQDDPVRATKRFEQLPVIKRFFSTDSGSIEAFYALKGEVDETVRTVNNMSRTNPQELKEYLDQKHLNLYGLRSYINVMSNYMDNIRAARNAINLNKNLTADEKQERLERLHQAEVKVTENIRALRKRFEQPS